MNEPVIRKSADFLRQEITEKIRRHGALSIDLAFLLGKFRAEQHYRTLGYPSFLKWLEEEICNKHDEQRNFMARSHAYALSDIGIAFKDKETAIKARFNASQVGIRQLERTVALMKSGLEQKDAEAYLLEDKPLPPEYAGLDPSEDPEQARVISISIPPTMYIPTKVGALKYAVMFGHKTLSEAFVAAVMDYYEHDLSNRLTIEGAPIGSNTFLRFIEAIEAGDFSCKCCGKIPQQPTWHHVIPRSLGGEDGPQVILCATPCHYDIVQPEWKKFAKKWGYDVEGLIKEYGDSRRAAADNNPAGDPSIATIDTEIDINSSGENQEETQEVSAVS